MELNVKCSVFGRMLATIFLPFIVLNSTIYNSYENKKSQMGKMTTFAIVEAIVKKTIKKITCFVQGNVNKDLNVCFLIFYFIVEARTLCIFDVIVVNMNQNKINWMRHKTNEIITTKQLKR